MEATPQLLHAQAALAAGDWSTAAQAFRRVLEDAADPDAFFGLGIAEFWMGETQTAFRNWERAFVGYRRSQEHAPAVIAAGYLSLAYGMSLGNAAAARGWLARAARIVDEQGLADLRAWILICRAHLANDTGRPMAAERWAREARDLAIGIADVDLELCAVSELGAALIEQGKVEQGNSLLDEAMAGALGGEGRDRDAVVLISCRSIAACSRGGEIKRATEWIRAADDFHRRYGSPHLYTTCRTQYGGILFATGQWEAAERELQAALQIGDAAEPALHAEALAKLAELRVAQGRIDDAAQRLVGYEDHPVAAYPLALIHLARGEPIVAVARLRRRLREIDQDCLEATALQELLVEAEIEIGARDRAAARAARLADVGDGSNSEFIRARGHRSVGRVVVADGEREAAVERFETAMAAFGGLGMPLEIARTRMLIAQALVGLQREVAVAEARTALAAFDGLGATRDADAAAAMLRSLGVRVARGGPRAAGALTRRELEVLRLLAEGLSNPEIGDRLFITRKTVEHHVASVLAKVGLSGRGEAAAYAVRHLERDSIQK